MIKDAINRIIELNRPETVEPCGDGRIYIKQGYTFVNDPIAETMQLHTLTGIKDYITDRIDVDGKPENLIIHIKDYDEVHLTTELFGKWKQRETRLLSKAFPHAKVNGQWKSIDDFIIMLHSEFVKTEESERLMRLVAGVIDSASAELNDDGISQTVTARAGVSFVKNEKIENPFILQPHRTFTEIDQPDVRFVFRIQKRGGVECALFESDGGKWKTDAIQKIKNWFESNLEGIDHVKIIA